jgi:hypothetical protein
MIHILVDGTFSITYSNISALAGQDLAQILGQNGYLILLNVYQNMSRARGTFILSPSLLEENIP